MKRSKTFIATPPGATIKEQLFNRGMTQKSSLPEWICLKSILAGS